MKENSPLKYLILLSQIGILIVSNIFVVVVIYKLVEKFFGENGLLFILFLMIGFISGFYSVYRLIKKI